MKIGIMQPYFLPHAGYFSLISAVDIFVFYDDVQHIRKGWINRNRIKNANAANGWEYINVPLRRSPRGARIREIQIHAEGNWREKLERKLLFHYKKAPFFMEAQELMGDILACTSCKISEFNFHSIASICRYLDIVPRFVVASDLEYDRSLGAQERLIEITRLLGGDTYLNAIGGLSMYSKEDFARASLKLQFVKPAQISYRQGKGNFVPNLSIIDTLMWNSKESAREMVYNYTLV